MFLFFQTLFFILPVYLASVDFSMLEEPHAFNDQTIEIRGFIYQSEEGKWILAAEPSLKSCCVGVERLLTKQIFLKGTIEKLPSHEALTLQGKFWIQPIVDEQGVLKELYHLQVDKPIIKKIGLSFWMILACIGFIFAIFCFCIKRK
jgi:hypothetical protein